MCLCSCFGREEREKFNVWVAWLNLESMHGAPEPDQALICSYACREEREKFNVWVAWLNLESMHGAPEPDQALMALFQRALQHCDQKKLYLALLGILERLAKVQSSRHLQQLVCVLGTGAQRRCCTCMIQDGSWSSGPVLGVGHADGVLFAWGKLLHGPASISNPAGGAHRHAHDT